MKDYSKIKALAQSILECIGDEPEGASPSLPKQDNSINNGGQDELYKMAPAADDFSAGAKDAEGESEPDDQAESEPEDKKKKKDSELAMMGSMLAAKFRK